MVTPPPRVFPNCPKCQGKNFISQSTTFKKTEAIIVYCSSCGSILGIINSKEKK